MSQFDKAYATRDLVLQRLKEDLLGGDFDDVLTEPPLSRFVLGVLYPHTEDSGHRPVDDSIETAMDVHEEDIEGGPLEPSDAPVDPAVSLAHVRHPKSMGLTFSVRADTGSSVVVEVDAASYHKTDGKVWQRKVLPTWRAGVDFLAAGVTRREVTDGLELVATVRQPRSGSIAITLSLVNTRSAPRGDRDSSCWFSPGLRVMAGEARFAVRPTEVGMGTDEDEVASQRMLFRDVGSWAVGHGCATVWRTDSEDIAFEIATTYIPRHELLLSETGKVEEVNLTMDHLATTHDFAGLQRLADSYGHWIEGLHLPEDAAEHEDVANRHVRDAEEAARRMKDGIQLLKDDDSVRRAFQLMNITMAEQRSRQEHHRAGHLDGPPTTVDAAWRPFQIAFILTNLRGLADGEHPDRKLADVLWFPTGGGKTEAYLGLIAIAILLRRLRNPEASGVSVLMRYTLRLLTLQQFQRAAGLICAIEDLRSKELPETEPVSVGLWVGQGSTPNSVSAARRILDRARRGRGAEDTDDDGGDPVQLRQCPWCGTPMDYHNYEIVDRSWMKVACGRPSCAFRNGLPVHIIDDDVYAARPSLVIATVDKFAMLPWKRDAGVLLGAHTPAGHGNIYPPPDLIIQDELHLISGPLGTVVGLYETAVDAICTRPHPPKLVASTATIRRAADQVKAVFAREARQFPPPGLTHRDSYFAVEADRERKGTRDYAGVMAPGTSQSTLMVRVYASLLQSASSIPADDPTADLYWTLLGYFNSLRVLGGAYIQVIDDVPDQMKVVASRRSEEVRKRPEPREMTSRKKSWEIPVELAILERPRGDELAADVVLATNMISVGVDVDRLGLMVVMGQPQSSAEYIQATSRVGRKMPGLVVTLYNAARSRDLSHYENFPTYHRMLYRHVEATGATPFAPRARDRGLHAVLVALARHTIPAASANLAAKDAHRWQHELEACVDTIMSRLIRTHGLEGAPSGDQLSVLVRRQLDTLVEEWSDSEVTHYEGWFDKRRGALLVEAARTIGAGSEAEPKFPPGTPPWPTLTSMRDVDAESNVYLVPARRRGVR